MRTGRAGDHGKGEESEVSFHLPRDPSALTFLFPCPPIYSLLSLALDPPLKNPTEPLRTKEPGSCSTTLVSSAILIMED